MITEEDAKQRWCPFGRSVFGSPGTSATSGNRLWDNKPDPDSFCIASQCMAWEWDKKENKRKSDRAYTEWRDTGCDNPEVFETSQELSSARQLFEGDCGLKRK